MGHLLATVNPEAARAIDDRRPLPRVGQAVVYHPRPNEIRQGRSEIPAMVTRVDVSNRLLELIVMFEAADMITQPNVPQHVEGDRGWSYLPEGNTDALEAKIKMLTDQITVLDILTKTLVKDIYGDIEMPDGSSILNMLDLADGRLGALEDAAATSAKLAKMHTEAQEIKRTAEQEHEQPRRRLRGNRA